MLMLTPDLVQLGATAADKAEAIRKAGELLVRAGCVAPGYVAGMQAREQTMSTYLGAGVAIPHGTHDTVALVHRTAISVLQVPQGVEWEPGEMAYLVVGIAAVGDEHIDVLARLGQVVEDEAVMRWLVAATEPAAVVACLSRAADEGEAL
jgi:mannitol/fructose-specific phosphotransferase system IIA component